MTKQVFFSATMQKSPVSIPARFMTEFNLDRVVYFVLRGGTLEQRPALVDLLAPTILARVPLKRGRNREMWICRSIDAYNDAQILEHYDTLLLRVFGDKCRIRVRIMWKGGAL